MLPFWVIKTSAELEAINCTVSPLNLPCLFRVSNSREPEWHLHRLIGQRESDSQLVLVCYRVRDTSTVPYGKSCALCSGTLGFVPTHFLIFITTLINKWRCWSDAHLNISYVRLYYISCQIIAFPEYNFKPVHSEWGSNVCRFVKFEVRLIAYSYLWLQLFKKVNRICEV